MMTRPEDVTNAMVSAADFAMGTQPGREHTSVAQMRAAIAAAINASACVLVPREPTEAMLDALYQPWDMSDDDIRQMWARVLAAADPRQQSLDRMAEDAHELGLYDEGKEKGDGTQ